MGLPRWTLLGRREWRTWLARAARPLLVAAITFGPALPAFADDDAGADTRPTAVTSDTTSQVIPGEFIVALNDSVADPVLTATLMAAQYGLGLKHTYRYAIKGFAVTIPDLALPALKLDARVQFVAPNRSILVSGQEVPTGIRRVGADQSTARSGDGGGSVDIDIAVIDTGIDGSHQDLTVVGGHDCTDSSRGWSDDNGHGTHVAGIAAARDNGTGVVGVAPGARLWAVKVLNSKGSGSWAQIICGIDWVTKNKDTITVANMSLSGSGSDDGRCGLVNLDPLHKAICGSVNAGITYVVAAGNSKADAATRVPAAYEEVITVSALTDFDGLVSGAASTGCDSAQKDDTFATWSNHGRDVDIAAPGVCVLSTYKGGGYVRMSGTSMSTPYVAGAAGLFKSRNRSASPAQVRSGLLTKAEPLGSAHTDPSGKHPEPVLQVKGL